MGTVGGNMWRKILGFLCFLSALPVSVLAQKIWIPIQDGRLVAPSALCNALWVGLFFCVGMVLVGRSHRARLPLMELGLITAASIWVAVALDLTLTRGEDASQLGGAAPGVSIVLAGLLLGCCILEGWDFLRKKGTQKGSIAGAGLLAGLVVLAAAFDLLGYTVKVSREWFVTVGAYRAAMLAKPLLTFGGAALAAAVLLPRRAVPRPLAILALCVTLFPYVILLARLNEALPALLRPLDSIGFGPTAAVYGLFLGLAVTGFIPRGRPHPAEPSAAAPK